jgi:hypothetical protein
MGSTFAKTDQMTLEKTESEVSAALVHKTGLLRLRNWLRSPLLRLPTETVVQILSYIMQDMELSHVWRPIFSTCHRIHTIMCTTTELWWKANFTLDKAAHLTFMRSMGNLREIIVDFQAWEDWREGYNKNAVDFCRQNLVFRGDGLHTVDLSGLPSEMTHWSWMFERPLPRLRHLKIHFYDTFGEPSSELSNPVPLELPTGLPLRVLDLRNAKLPWTSNLFTGLTELHLVYSESISSMDITEDELLRILDASPQLERLSLVDLVPTLPTRDYLRSPARVVQLPRLTFLKLDNSPQFVGYLLAILDAPAIVSLEIRAQLSSWGLDWYIDFFFPNDRFSSRVFPNPPIFEVWPETGEAVYDSLRVNIGSAQMQFDFDMDEPEVSCSTIMGCIYDFVPWSVTTLRLDYSGLDEGAWEAFFISHPEVLSIECSKSAWDPVSGSLWDALSPIGPTELPLCPKLESISVYNIPEHTPLLECLRKRKDAGFGLKHLELWGVDARAAEEFRILVEELHVFSKPVDLTEKVRPRFGGSGMC